MPRFFVESKQIVEGVITLVGSDAHHISRSLRMAVGEHITVSDFSGKTYECELSAFLPAEVQAKILSVSEKNTEPPYTVTLFQALPKGEKLDTVIQKAVECGASLIVPFESERCIVRMKKENEAHKTERRNRIAAEAAKQCGRSLLPEVLPTTTFDEMLKAAATADLALFCYEGEGTRPIGEILAERSAPPRSIAMVIGSEGGFSTEEALRAATAGLCMTGLGPRILRAETAPIFALAALSAHFELTPHTVFTKKS